MNNDTPDITRRSNQIRIPAVVVSEGVMPGPELHATIGSPVRFRIQGKRRTQAANRTGGPGASGTGNGTAQSSPSGGSTSGDPNIPIGPTGRPSMAPRET